MYLCAICKKTDEPLVLVTDRRVNGLLKYSNERKDGKWRKWYNYKRRLCTEDNEKIECRSSKHASTFEWEMNCFLCGDKFESKKNFHKNWRLAAIMEIRQTIEMRCREHMRENTEDQWALEVL